MALMILAHPYFDVSVANKTIIQELQKQDLDLEIRDIHQLYPNYQIDVAAEQEALLRHDTIILQFPMFWFSMPAILKQWFDSVFTYQFAYGSKGDKLKNKKLLPSLTVGQIEGNFYDGEHFLIDDFLRSIQKSAEYSQMEYLKPTFLFGVSPVEGNTKEEVQAKAKKQSQRLAEIIRSL